MRVQDVGFAASVRTDDRRHTAVEIENRPRRERLETNHFKGLKIHEQSSRLREFKLKGRWSPLQGKTLYIAVPSHRNPNLLSFYV